MLDKQRGLRASEKNIYRSHVRDLIPDENPSAPDTPLQFPHLRKFACSFLRRVGGF